MKNQILSQIREVTYSLRDENGNWRENVIGALYNARTTKKNTDILKGIVSILLNSDNIQIETKIYISNKRLSIKSVNEYLNDIRKATSDKLGKQFKSLSYNNTNLKIANDNKKLVNLFGSNTIKDIVYNRIANYNILDKLINTFVIQFGVFDKNRDNLLVNIQSSNISKNRYMDNEEFFEILSKLEPYLIQRKNIIERQVNEDIDFVEYFNYLLSSKAVLDEDVKVDRERLLRFLNNEDYISNYGGLSRSNLVQQVIDELDTKEIEEEPVNQKDSLESYTGDKEQIADLINSTDKIDESTIEERSDEDDEYLNDIMSSIDISEYSQLESLKESLQNSLGI